MTTIGDADEAGRQAMTRFGAEGRPAAALAADTEPALPDRLSWPAAAAVIGVVSLALWGMIGLAIVWLIG
jgi:hypothetical protein